MPTDSIHEPTSNAAQAETDNPPIALHGAPDRNVGQEPLAGTYECCFCGIDVTEIHYPDERCHKCVQTDAIQRSTSLPFHAGFWEPYPAEDMEQDDHMRSQGDEVKFCEYCQTWLIELLVPRGLVSVRTIDDSPSHQAEFVICESGVFMQKDT
ncbi:hypothetical protein J3E69DRAFT_356141 [Trichoderma sp. SZMC 28015]